MLDHCKASRLLDSWLPGRNLKTTQFQRRSQMLLLWVLIQTVCVSFESKKAPQCYSPFVSRTPCLALWVCSALMLMLGGISTAKSPTEVRAHGYRCHQIIQMSSLDTPLFRESCNLIPSLIWYVKTDDTLMDFCVPSREGLRHDESEALSNV